MSHVRQRLTAAHTKPPGDGTRRYGEITAEEKGGTGKKKTASSLDTQCERRAARRVRKYVRYFAGKPVNRPRARIRWRLPRSIRNVYIRLKTSLYLVAPIRAHLPIFLRIKYNARELYVITTTWRCLIPDWRNMRKVARINKKANKTKFKKNDFWFIAKKLADAMWIK